MEAIIHQALSDVINTYAADLGDLAQIQNALVCHQTVSARVENWEIMLQLSSDVVGRENRNLGCVS